MFHGKPIVGITGGIGAGKSFVARLLGDEGFEVISSDDLANAAYESDEVRNAVTAWWGVGVLDAAGRIDRSAVAKIVFADPAQRQRLEALLHPIVAREREARMSRALPRARGFVWDSPLLVETGLVDQCDFVVYVDAPQDLREKRVAASRGWPPGEIARRENFQTPLDKKRAVSDYTVTNAADAASTRDQVRELLPLILANSR